jgi:hypothetical protein
LASERLIRDEAFELSAASAAVYLYYAIAAKVVILTT